jgi:cobalamin biosynthesis protein CobT
MASVDHEVAHDRFSSFKVLKDIAVDPKSLLMFTWNFLEDSRVNTIEAQEYKGFKENWDDCSSEIVKKILEKSTVESSSMAKLVTALLCWESQVSKSNFPLIELVTAPYKPAKKITDVLNSLSSDLITCHRILDKELGTRATYELALKILKTLEDEVTEKPKEIEKPSSSKGTGKVDTEKGDSDEKTSSSEPSDVAKGGNKDASDKADDDYKIIKVVLTEDDLKKFSLTTPEDGREMGKTGINFDPVTTSGPLTWDLTDYKHFLVVNYPKNLGESRFLEFDSKSKKFIDEYKVRVTPFLVTQENFGQQVRRLIQIRARVQTQYGTRKGKLDQSRLSRICFNAPGLSEKVFKTKIENKTLDAAITVLVDMSGSMGGEKAYYALASTLLLNEVCSTLGIPLEVLGFTDGYTKTHDIVPFMYIYKAFSDLKVSEDVMTTSFAKSSNFMNGNPDGENILWAHDRLVKRKERKRLMIVMSDGAPAASKSSVGLEAFTLQAIQEIEKSKKIDIYGLGLCSKSVEHYYKRHDVVSKPQEIPSKLLELIEKRILT